MPDIQIRVAEGQDVQPTLLWDSQWDTRAGQADWVLAGFADRRNAGGMRADNVLHTAVVLALFTDRYIPVDHPLRKYIDGDPGGYFGDGVDVRTDLGEGEMGSMLHALERVPANEEIRQWVEAIAQEALAPLVAQRACVRIEAIATLNEVVGRIELVVRLYGRDGQAIYDRNFEELWKQTLA